MLGHTMSDNVHNNEYSKSSSCYLPCEENFTSLILLNKIYMKREIKSIDRKYLSVHTIMNNYSLKRSRSMPFGEYFLKHVGFNEWLNLNLDRFESELFKKTISYICNLERYLILIIYKIASFSEK